MDNHPDRHDVWLWHIDVPAGPAEVERCADDACDRCAAVEPVLLEDVAA